MLKIMTFVPTYLRAAEDIPTSSISLSVSNASNDSSLDVYWDIYSAPSECVFPVAGLTTAKDRAHLASAIANELIFLHNAFPGIQKYYEAQNV
jgi:hypothetical protein